MSKVFTSADQLIGKTPLLELTHLEKSLGLEAKLVAPMICQNNKNHVKTIKKGKKVIIINSE